MSRCADKAPGCAGEINTLQGNLNWVASREHSLQHPVWGGREHEFLPLTSSKQVRGTPGGGGENVLRACVNLWNRQRNGRGS